MANRFLEPFSYFTPYLHFDTGLTVPQAAQAAAAAGSVGSVTQQPGHPQQPTHVPHQQHNQPAIGYQNPYYNHFMTQNLNRLVKIGTFVHTEMYNFIIF